jgi:hypothetical protein
MRCVGVAPPQDPTSEVALPLAAQMQRMRTRRLLASAVSVHRFAALGELRLSVFAPRMRFGASTIERWLYAARNAADPVVALARKVPSHAGTYPT